LNLSVASVGGLFLDLHFHRLSFFIASLRDVHCERSKPTHVCSVRSRQVSHREFDLTVGKLPPVFDNSRVSDLRELIEDFAGFATSRINRQREYLRLLARHSVC
jgi:hypothetical protein